MSASADRGEDQRFTPTSGTVIGWVGIGVCVIALASIAMEAHTVVGARYAFAVAICGVVVWCFMLRPRLIIGATELELRNAFSSWHVSLASVRRVAVRALTRVFTEDRHFDGIAVGRPVRAMKRTGQSNPRMVGLPGMGASLITGPDAPRKLKGELDAGGVADFVGERILYAADAARSAGHEPTPARRTWATVELVVLAVLAVGFVVSLML